jgi:hypothetical protein
MALICAGVQRLCSTRVAYSDMAEIIRVLMLGRSKHINGK